MMAGLNRKEITKGMVVVIRYEGPKGGPGMPEMLTPTSAIMGAGTLCRFIYINTHINLLYNTHTLLIHPSYEMLTPTSAIMGAGTLGRLHQ